MNTVLNKLSHFYLSDGYTKFGADRFQFTPFLLFSIIVVVLLSSNCFIIMIIIINVIIVFLAFTVLSGIVGKDSYGCTFILLRFALILCIVALLLRFYYFTTTAVAALRIKSREPLFTYIWSKAFIFCILFNGKYEKQFQQLLRTALYSIYELILLPFCWLYKNKIGN